MFSLGHPTRLADLSEVPETIHHLRSLSNASQTPHTRFRKDVFAWYARNRVSPE